MRSLFLLTTILLLGFNFYGYSQNDTINDVRNFDIKVAGVIVGEMKATKKHEDTITHYTINSKVKFWFFVTVAIEHTAEVLYYNDKLIYSKSTSVTNNGTYLSTIIWNKDKYDVEVNTYDYVNKRSINKVIKHNVATLYFEEPKAVKELLLDSFGEMATVTTTKVGTYLVEVSGKKNYFEYKDGKLVLANVHSKFKNYNVVARAYDD
ncbi:hypothetical protein SanaruYs_04010 [Chryseotalea sanaruensis]|uniref:Uncharacterized protein n=1 Tax=Chryseotalea sanaruensis TaxID=2482724 RepID=A0A401U5X0_9BACT|nr:DUF6134 family protein [Chryseotalea sanaruensis]GCC50186.1 hypothetical protein SanaruYs_04010 [Chryseotalea sanaruensis]